MVYATRFIFNHRWFAHVPHHQLIDVYPIFYGSGTEEFGQCFVTQQGEERVCPAQMETIRALLNVLRGRPSLILQHLAIPKRVQANVQSVLKDVDVVAGWGVTHFTPGESDAQWCLIQKIINAWTYKVRALKKNKSVRREEYVVEDVGAFLADDVCAICREDAFTDPVMTMPCNHAFCDECLQGWFRIQGRRTCPMCRGEVVSVRPIVAKK